MGSSKATLSCALHGVLPWSGQIVCETCSRVYRVAGLPAENHVPEECACGERLMPSEAEPDADFTARPCCSQCWQILLSGGDPLRAAKRFLVRCYSPHGQQWRIYSHHEDAQAAGDAFEELCRQNPNSAIDLKDQAEGKVRINALRDEQLHLIGTWLRQWAAHSSSPIPPSSEDGAEQTLHVKIQGSELRLIELTAKALSVSIETAIHMCIDMGCGMLAGRLRDPEMFKEVNTVLAQVQASGSPPTPEELAAMGALIGDEARDASLRALGFGDIADRISKPLH